MICFKPYFKLQSGRNGLNIWLDLHIYCCNSVGLSWHIWGYGFDIGFICYKPNDWN